jgi:hypothetical protein
LAFCDAQGTTFKIAQYIFNTFLHLTILWPPMPPSQDDALPACRTQQLAEFPQILQQFAGILSLNSTMKRLIQISLLVIFAFGAGFEAHAERCEINERSEVLISLQRTVSKKSVSASPLSKRRSHTQYKTQLRPSMIGRHQSPPIRKTPIYLCNCCLLN